MKCLLAAINAKYIHSNLGIYNLKKYAEVNLPADAEVSIELGEYTINNEMEVILQDIYRRKPDILGISCYIWNIRYVKDIVRDVKKVLPETRIWLGGPEVCYDADKTLTELPEAELVMMGEGEEVFTKLLEMASHGEKPGTEIYENSDESSSTENRAARTMAGAAYRTDAGDIVNGGPARIMNMDEIPFAYDNLEQFENRIIYYESSRGCPFSCSYCLSSIDKRVRFRSLEKVLPELQFFLDNRVPQVKFVDRTFNCKKSHSMAIWRYITEHDNGVTNFHFEISADLLDDEELALLKTMRPGLIQLEIGVQTTNTDTVHEIRRTMNLDKLAVNVATVNSFTNIHQHLDLIAGLPYEDIASFRRSFDDVYAMQPEELQLGFLKVLKGSYMETKTEDYGLVYRGNPPYEVLKTKWLSFDDVIHLKEIEDMVEVYYNSGQFRETMKYLTALNGSAYDLYEKLADYYAGKGLAGLSHSRLARFEILYDFIVEYVSGLDEAGCLKDRCDASAKDIIARATDLLMIDLYLRENAKSRPKFAPDLAEIKDIARDFFRKEEQERKYLPGYEGYDHRQLIKMAHLERLSDGSFRLFDYRNREVFFGNARMLEL